MDTIVLSRDQSRKIDQIAIEKYGISGVVLMENAGRGVVDRLESLGIHGIVAICCGRGNNAGDGFVIARHLEIRGFRPNVLLWADPAGLTGDAALNYQILAKTDVPITVFGTTDGGESLQRVLNEADWVVDALLGTGARGEPRPPLDEVLRRMNQAESRRLAVDVPSGLDCDSGQAASVTFQADHTCTFVTPKSGLLASQAQRYVGDLHVVDIGIPPKLIHEI